MSSVYCGLSYHKNKPKEDNENGYEYCMPGFRGRFSTGDLDRICRGKWNPVIKKDNKGRTGLR